MGDDTTSTAALAAVSTIVGYLGAEVATASLFERLLWPQRFFNEMTPGGLVKEALLMPMGGPLHKAALEVIDKAVVNGLLKGKDQGNMLGTSFFRDTGLKYTMHDVRSGASRQIKDARNAFWPRVVEQLPLLGHTPDQSKVSKEDQLSAMERGLKRRKKQVRARKAVSVLTLSYEDGDDIEASAPSVGNDIGHVTFSCFVQLVVSEATGIVMAVLACVLWRSPFMFLFLLPLALKLLSAKFSIPREDLSRPQSKDRSSIVTDSKADAKIHQEDKSVVFEVHGLENGFLLIQGDPALVQQFFRHYGHPVRDRLREVVQVLIVAGFGLIFPLGLVCSIVWMNLGMGYLWFGYQLYATMALHVYRCMGGRDWASTEERMAAKLGCSGKASAVLRGGNGVAVRADLVRVMANCVEDGREMVRRFLQNQALDSMPLSPPERTRTYRRQSSSF